MRDKEDLFRLVKAMSKSEKRYFTVDAKKGGTKSSNYLKLFQAINGMDEYDDEKLKKKFPKNLSADKSYLYEAILRSMRDYRSSKSYAAQIKEKLLDFKYLYELGLHDQCEERLREAKELAVELGDELALLEINREERRLVRDDKKKKFGERIEQLMGEKETHLHALKEEFQHLDNFDLLLLEVVRHFKYNSADKIEGLKNNFGQLLDENKYLPSTSQAKRRYFQTLALYHQLLGNSNEVLTYYSKVIDWWNENAKYKNEEFYRFIIDNSNLLHAYYIKKDFDEISKLIVRLSKEEPDNQHDKATLFNKTIIYKLISYINSESDIHLSDLEKDIEKGLKEFNINPGSRMAIVFNFAVLSFIREDFVRCMKWFNFIIYDIKNKVRNDIRNAAYMLRLVASLETEDVENTELLIRSTHRYFTEKRNLEKSSFEIKVLSFLKKIHNASYSDRNSLLESFEDYLQSIKEDPNKKDLLGSDELFLCWIESRQNREPIYKVVHRMNQQVYS